MESTKVFFDLLEVAPVKRDMNWEKSFLQSLPHISLEILHEAPQTGPDGWPYLMVKTAEAGSQPAAKVLAWLAERGIGLAVNPDKPAPDYVLPYGMIWNFKATGAFLTDAPVAQAGPVEIAPGAKLHAGPPSAEYLPEYARSVLKAFFSDNQIQKMKVLVMSQDGQNYDLCFSAECLGHPPAEEVTNVLEAISWFLPAHYSLVVVSEEGLPPFHDL
jgi:hypothetical protein